MIEILRLDSQAANFNPILKALLSFEQTLDERVESAVAGILSDVKKRGDEAVLEYTRRFDRLDVASMDALSIPKSTLEAAFASLPAAQRDALVQAAGRIRSYHERQVQQSWEFTDGDGNRLGQKITPLERVGIYVPGGKAAYPSTVMMNSLPARVAGVREVVMVVPTPDGERNALVLAAAALCGVDRVFAVGGAQAIGALAYGTQSVKAVDKIVGPGNAYVASAKRQVFGTVGIDMVAGPSEILVISDGSGNPDWVAMDLFSQAEHDEQAQAILMCPDQAFLDAVQASMTRLVQEMPRKDIILTSLRHRGALIRVRNLEEACDIANFMAPEHLELSVGNPEALLDRIHNAGAIFIGHYTSEALGDYCAGPNHVLPTGRTARFSSPLGVYDFQKRTSLIQVSRDGADKLGRIASELARGEGLTAHARSAEMRLHR